MRHEASVYGIYLRYTTRERSRQLLRSSFASYDRVIIRNAKACCAHSYTNDDIVSTMPRHSALDLAGPSLDVPDGGVLATTCGLDAGAVVTVGWAVTLMAAFTPALARLLVTVGVDASAIDTDCAAAGVATDT
jgi:hypothetical protein